MYDATTYDNLWEAGSTYEPFDGTLTLSLTGSTITGTGGFFPAGDITAAPVNGTVEAHC